MDNLEKNGTRITMVRHGETEWNKIGKQQGHLDSHLTETGIQQANRVAGIVKAGKYDLLYSSDMGRALQTAEIIAAKLHIPVIKEQGLRERNLGILQGLTIQEFKEKYPDEYEKFINNDPDYILPQGESIRQRYERSIACLQEMEKKNRGKNLLIVAHGGTLDSIFRYILNIPLSAKRNFSLINASINTFSYLNNEWKLESWGETCNLKGLSALDDF